MNVVDLVQLKLFLAELSHARAIEKDRRAEAAIRRMLERQPDAAYLLVQRVMQLENALCRVQAIDVIPGRAGAPSADRPASPHADERWWLQPAAAFAGVAFLARSAEYLLGPWV